MPVVRDNPLFPAMRDKIWSYENVLREGVLYIYKYCYDSVTILLYRKCLVTLR